MRLTAGLAALCAVLAPTAPAAAQEERSKAVSNVYRDYRDDGVIDACDHSRQALKRTLDGLAPEADVETPDLRPALEAGIEQHASRDCEAQAEPTPTPTPTPVPTPAPTSTPNPDDSVDSGTVAPSPPAGDGGGGGSGGSPTPPGAEDVTPLDPAVTPVPPAETPVPPPAAEPAGPPPAPAAVYSNADDALPPSLLVPAGLLVVLALLGLVYALVSRLGWADARLAGPRRAWREATFRAGGTWGDFADWIRAGR